MITRIVVAFVLCLSSLMCFADPMLVESLAVFAQQQNTKLSAPRARSYSAKIVKYANEFNIDPMLLFALVARESHFRPNVTSSAGAKGLAQVIPQYHMEKFIEARRRFGTSDPYNADVSLYVGAWIYSEYSSRSRTVTTALQRYNGSLGDRTYKYPKRVTSVLQKVRRHHIDFVQEAFFRQFV